MSTAIDTPIPYALRLVAPPAPDADSVLTAYVEAYDADKETSAALAAAKSALLGAVGVAASKHSCEVDGATRTVQIIGPSESSSVDSKALVAQLSDARQKLSELAGAVAKSLSTGDHVACARALQRVACALPKITGLCEPVMRTTARGASVRVGG